MHGSSQAQLSHLWSLWCISRAPKKKSASPATALIKPEVTEILVKVPMRSWRNGSVEKTMHNSCAGLEFGSHVTWFTIFWPLRDTVARTHTDTHTRPIFYVKRSTGNFLFKIFTEHVLYLFSWFYNNHMFSYFFSPGLASNSRHCHADISGVDSQDLRVSVRTIMIQGE